MSSRSRVASVRHGKLKQQKPIVTLLKIIGSVIAVIAVSIASVGAITVYGIQNGLRENAVELDSAPEPSNDIGILPQIGAFEGGANILLVGSDSGGGNASYGVRDAELNDVTILIHLNSDNSGMTVISFPRDTFVSIPECTHPETGVTSGAVNNTKINQALSRGGLACVARTVEQLTGASIPYAALIEFDGVVEMSNAVGGVTVCVNEDINDSHTGLVLSAGEHTLQGAEALSFLRSRHGVGDGSDLGRISNQQVFLSALMRTIKSDETLNDISKLYNIAHVASENVTLSTSLTGIDTMVSFALAVKDIPLERIVFIQYPTAIGNSGSQSGVFPIKSAAGELMDAVLTDKPIALTGGTAPGDIGSIVVDDVPDPDAAPNPSGTPTPAPETTEDPEPPTSLPPAVTGQTASQVTCSNAN